MMKFMKKNRGGIAVFLLLILLPMSVFQCLLIDASRLAVAKNAASAAGSSAMNGALADYNSVVKDVYGIFAISSGKEELQENVEKYFKETLSAANIDEEALKASLEDTANFLNMTADSVAANTVSGSQLSNSEVMRAEILEYMKYRGLVSMGSGILEKFSSFSALSKEQKAVEKKLEYDEQLDEVQKALQEAYDKINSYLAMSIDYAYLAKLEPTVRGKYNEICKCIAEDALAYEVTDYTNETYNKNYKKQAKLLSKDEIISFLDTFQEEYYRKNRQNSFVQKLRNKTTKIDNEADAANRKALLKDCVDIWQENCQAEDDENKDLTYGELFAKALCYYGANSLLSSDRAPYAATFNNLKSKILNKYNLEEIEKKCTKLNREKVNNNAEYCYKDLNYYADILKEAGNALKTAKKKLEAAKDAADNLKDKKEEWQKSIDKLPDGESKSSMNSEVKTRTEQLDIDKLNNLVEWLDEAKSIVDDARKECKKISFHSEKLYKYHVSDYYEVYSKLEEKSSADKMMQTYYTGATITTKSWGDSLITDNDFYKYLESICKKDKDDNKKTENKNNGGETKEDPKDTKQSMLKMGELKDSLSKNVDNGNRSYEAKEEKKDADIAVDSTGKDKDLSGNCKTMSSSYAGLFEKMGDILKTGRNKLLLEEYVTEMFSCFTDEANAKSLSGNCFKTSEKIPSYNFNSEVEYLLFGKAKPSENVEAARTRIYGVRLVLNLIYAFTGDPEIRTETLAVATAIAGWTGFGVPIVQNVLIFALALAESAIDTMQLMAGESVVIYKSPTTWNCKVSGGLSKLAKKTVAKVAQEAATNLGNKALDAAVKKIDGWINSGSKITKDKIGELNGSLQTMIDDKVDSLTSNAVNTVFSPIESASLSIFSDPKIDGSQINTKVEELFTNLQKSIDEDENEITKFAAGQCLELLKSKKSELIQGIKSGRDSFLEKLKNIRNSISSNLSKKIKNSKYMQAFKAELDSCVDELDDAIDKAAGKAEEEVEKAAEKAKSKMAETISKWSGGLGDETISVAKTKPKSASVGSMVTMNYKEYLKLFAVIGLLNNEKAVLNRVTMLIGLNASNSNNAEAKKFDYKNAFTMVKIDAKVSLDTLFMRNIAGYIDQSMPSYLDNAGKYTFTYRGVLGY